MAVTLLPGKAVGPFIIGASMNTCIDLLLVRTLSASWATLGLHVLKPLLAFKKPRLLSLSVRPFWVFRLSQIASTER